MTQLTPSNADVPRNNWSANIQFQATNFHAPTTVEELQEIISRATKVKVVGSGHCFNDIADSTETLISLSRLDKTVTVDPVNQTATVPAGMTYIELAPILHQQGVALKNMASLPQLTVIGACMTATHGSGDGNGNLATQVAGLEMVKADGELVQLTRETDGERLNGIVVSLGGLGTVTRVTLDIVPAYTMRQQIYRELPLANMADNFDAIMSSGYSVSMFTQWRNMLRGNQIVDQVWVKELVVEGGVEPIAPTLFGATLAEEKRNPLDKLEADACTEQLGIPGPWYERLPHFHLQSKLTGEDELQTEYFVARDDAVDALLVFEALSEKLAPVFKVMEVRSMSGDNLWLSMANGRDTVGLHISWYHQLDEVMARLPLIERTLEPFKPRPHWGKLHTMPSEQVQGLYERMDNFRLLLSEFDPERKFSNPYINRYIWGD